MSFMGIDCVWADDGEDTSDDMTGHDARFKIGVISSCYKLKVVNLKLKVSFMHLIFQILPITLSRINLKWI